MKVVAVLIAAVSLVAIASGVWFLAQAPAIAATLALMAEGIGRPFSSTNWLLHWRLGAIADVLLGLFGFASGIAMLRRRRWGFLLWAIVVSAVLLMDSLILLTGPPAYAFESVEPLELLFVAGLTAASWLYLIRSRPVPGSHSAT